MEFKACILAAGKNDRLKFAEDFPVAILPIGTASSITKIIEKFPLNIEIVMAVGYKSRLIKDFIKIAHANRKITFVDIGDYSTAGSGPGKSLLLCKDHLKCPFIFTSADTIVSGPVPEPSKNWLGVSHVSDTTNYCMADVENNYVVKFHDKVPMTTLIQTCKNYNTILNNAFIGMAGIYDYKIFLDTLESNPDLIEKELQVSNGLSGLIERKIEVLPFFNWFDIGTEAGYGLANRFFNKNHIIDKPDEFIYFENGKVIKYFRNPKIIRERILRSQKLEGIVPPIVDITENFYSYNFIKGKILPKINDVAVFKELLNSCKEVIWREKSLGQEKEKFKELCKKFYKDKTLKRVGMFFSKSGIKDKEEIINGEKTMKVGEMLSLIDWDKLSEGIPVNFHGDFQPENILICDKGFQLIDWRHNFAGNIDYGDVYYDFAKLHHALIVTHEVIRNNQFEIKINNDVINYDFFIKSNLAEYKEIFERFIVEKGYDLDKLKILSALTFLNIAALHHTPYDNFLYYLGKHKLFNELENNNTYKLKR
ncbi:hypothetical protein GOV13_01195 [Candidatus Pacearchaeota archaeon]|nr:hypothetical protein [Candidatus Pacearchaeota archaeon]